MEGPLLRNSDQHHITISGDDNPSIIEQIANKVSICLILFEFVITLVQIITAIVLVTQAKGEEDSLVAKWIIAYTCGCISNLFITCWNFWQYLHEYTDQIAYSVILVLKMIVELFFAGWCVVFMWLLDSKITSMDDINTPLLSLSAIFICYSFFRYVTPLIYLAATCFWGVFIGVMWLSLFEISWWVI